MLDRTGKHKVSCGSGKTFDFAAMAFPADN